MTEAAHNSFNKILNKMEYNTHTVSPDGRQPFKFEGALIGETTGKTGTGRSINIEIYKKKSDATYITVVKHITQWQGERDSVEAHICGDFPAVIQSLKEDGHLGWISKEAIEDAVNTCPELEEHWILEI